MRLRPRSGKVAVTVALVVALASLGLIVLIGSRRGAEPIPAQGQPAAPEAPIAPDPEPARLEPQPPATPEPPRVPELALRPNQRPQAEGRAPELALAAPAPAEGYRARWQRAQRSVTLEPPAPALRPSGAAR